MGTRFPDPEIILLRLRPEIVFRKSLSVDSPAIAGLFFFMPSIVKGEIFMTVRELSKEQLSELKTKHVFDTYESPSMEQIAAAEGIPDEVISQEYEGYDFVDDDFWCSCNGNVTSFVRPSKPWLLISVLDRDIETDQFATLKEAQAQMLFELKSYGGVEDPAIGTKGGCFDDAYEITESGAWSNRNTMGDADWQIVELK